MYLSKKKSKTDAKAEKNKSFGPWCEILSSIYANYLILAPFFIYSQKLINQTNFNVYHTKLINALNWLII